MAAVSARFRPGTETWSFDTLPAIAAKSFSIFFRSHIEMLRPGDYGEHPLIHRGWVFQEWALSPRMIHFCKRELVFECRTSCICQCGESTLHFKGRFEEARNGREKGWMTEHPWCDFVEDHTSLDLSKMEDRLPASSALARRMGKQEGDRYLAGLWESTFAFSLGWFVPLGRVPRSRLPEPRAPSWSWDSVSSPAVFPGYMPEDSWSEVLSAECTSLGSDIFGQVKSGRLVIKGKVTKSLLRWSSPASLTASPLPGKVPSPSDMI
jgi:hypothetical protein